MRSRFEAPSSERSRLSHPGNGTPSSWPITAAARRQRSRRSSASRWERSRAGRGRRWTCSGSHSGHWWSRQWRHRVAVNDEHGRLVDDLAAYALEALPEPERARLEAHLASCATCPHLLTGYRAVVGMLPSRSEEGRVGKDGRGGVRGKRERNTE